jgi:hypothetical protein
MCSVEVKDSLIAGRGVFAKYDIAAHTICCYYDGHKVPRVQHKDFDPYALTVGDDVIYGFKQPRHPIGVGQLMNDVYMPRFRLYMTESEFMQSAIEYYQTSVLKSNVNTIGKKVVTMKPIKAGDELLFSYGLKYWLSHFVDEVMNRTSGLKEYIDDKEAPINLDFEKIIECLNNYSKWIKLIYK